VKKYTLDECLNLYNKYIVDKIKEDPNYYDLNELRGKNLGCWCNAGDRCHNDILIGLL